VGPPRNGPEPVCCGRKRLSRKGAKMGKRGNSATWPESRQGRRPVLGRGGTSKKQRGGGSVPSETKKRRTKSGKNLGIGGGTS